MKTRLFFIPMMLVPHLVFGVVATEYTQVLNNIQLVKQYYNQLESLYHEAVMIQNQVESLKSIANYKDQWNEINAIKSRIDFTILRGRQTAGNIKNEYEKMKALEPDLKRSGDITREKDNWHQTTADTVDGAMAAVDQQNEAMDQEARAVQALLAKNNEALGQTQAIQTLNQLTAQLINQMQELRQLTQQQIQLQSAYINQQISEQKRVGENMNVMIHPSGDLESDYHMGGKL